jgi:uncharacterized membrane protein YoaK (UPF0700 family)
MHSIAAVAWAAVAILVALIARMEHHHSREASPHWVRVVLWAFVGMAGFEAVLNAVMVK